MTPSPIPSYRQVWTEMSKCAMQAKVRRGEAPGCAPVGYLNKRDGDKTWVEVDPMLGSLVKEAFTLAVRSKYSLRQILEIVTAKGLISRRGKQLEVKALWYVLTNPFYTGYLRYDNTLLPGDHPPLITWKLFEKVQNNLRNRRRK